MYGFVFSKNMPPLCLSKFMFFNQYPGVLRTDRRAGWFLCGGMSDRLRNLWIEWVKITKKIMFPVQHSDREEISWMQTVRCGAVPCRVVPCRVVPCRAVPCRACVRACMRTQWNSVLKMMYRLPRRDDHHKMWFSKRFLGTWDYSLTRAEQKMCV